MIISIPSRLDFAKERFGGPFTTEQVENVKTFLRILLILFAVGPVFALEVPASFLIAPLFGMHLHHYSMKKVEYCRGKALLEHLMQTVGVLVLPTMIVFPVCSFSLVSLLRKKLLKLFMRIGAGILICLFGVLSLLITDIFGHAQNISNPYNHSQCVFQVTLSHNKSVTIYSLQHALGSSHPTKSSSWNWSLACYCHNLGVHLSSEPSVHERSSCWSLLCHQRSLSIPQFHYHHSLVLEAAVGQ